jgi:RNA-directed DNA polymerase
MATTTKQDRVRELQRALYRAAKADPERRFHALYDKVHRRDVLGRAWEAVRANRGAAGTDRITLADVERYGIDRLLDELATDLRDGRWRPLPARRVFIPKPGREELRPLSIPAVRPDRAGGREGGDRADLRGRLCRVLVWVSPTTLGARCPPGLDR